MQRSEWTSDSSCASDGSGKDPFAEPLTTYFIIPSPELLSDLEEDASPSQYRKEMARKESSGQSDDEDGEEEDDGEVGEMEEEEEAREPVKPHRPKMDDMYSEFINMARKFTSMVEDTRKQELMSRKTARQSLDFDSPPRQPAKYRHQQFTPPRRAREQIKATQDDDDEIERDSLCSSQESRDEAFFSRMRHFARSLTCASKIEWSFPTPSHMEFIKSTQEQTISF